MDTVKTYLFAMLMASTLATDNVKINNGVYFRRIQLETVVYSHWIPLTYTEVLPLSKEQIQRLTAAALPTPSSANATPEQSHAADLSCQLRNATEQLISTAIYNLKLDAADKGHAKRGIEAIGDAFQWCCNVALILDVAVITRNQQQFAERCENLREETISEHKTLIQLNSCICNVWPSDFSMYVSSAILIVGCLHGFSNTIQFQHTNQIIPIIPECGEKIAHVDL